MQYLILMTEVEGAWDALSRAQQDEVMKRHGEFRSSLEQAGCFVSSCHLHPAAEARTVRMDEAGNVGVEKGPFSGPRECVGGFYVIETATMDEALEWARRGRFMVGANEVRELHAGS